MQPQTCIIYFMQTDPLQAVKDGKSRGSAASRVVLGASVLVLGLAMLLGTLRLLRPSDDTQLRIEEFPWRPDGVLVTPLADWPGGLRHGDMVVAINGRSLETWARALTGQNIPRPQWRIWQQITYEVMRDGHPVVLALPLHHFLLWAVLARFWGTILTGLAALGIAGYVFAHRPADRAAQALFQFAAGIIATNLVVLSPQVSDILDPPLFWLSTVVGFAAAMLIWNAGLRFWLGFPALRRNPRLVPLLYIAPAAIYAAVVLRPGVSTMIERLGRFGEGMLALAIIFLPLALVASTASYRASADAAGRQRVRLVIGTGLVCGGSLVVAAPVSILALGHPLLDRNLLSLFLLPVLAALALAITRYHLFGIDVIVKRSLVYGALTAIVVALYVLVVGVLGSLFEARGSLFISLLATGLVAVVFQPLRERLQRSVNRLLYGERDDPYAVLSRLGRRLEATMAPDTVLPTIVETVAQALKLPYVALALGHGEDVAAAYGSPWGEPLVLPLAYQGEIIGRLILAPRAPGESFSPDDRRLLADLARQVEIAVHAVRVTADLQRSREHLVTAREEERRRLRRDLHDGLGPALAGLTLQLDAARNLLSQDLKAAEALLVQLKVQTQAAIADIRRLVYALRPPALDDLGLVSALRAQAPHYEAQGLRVAVEAPEELPALPAAVEVAAYRIALEALTNVARHARARTCRIRLELADALYVEILDDGTGLAAEYRAGVGMTSMRERATELGGSWSITSMPDAGTRVVARLPVTVRLVARATAAEESTYGADPRLDR